MYKEFLKLLEKATGRSDHIIAVNLDIRGFTPFCQKVDSLNVATYIKKIYRKIINNYFKNALFYKPTGDGLIIIIPFTEETLKDVANQIIDSCLKLLQDFSSLCDDEPMINFPTPEKIGIGVTRGGACCIVTGDTILDYSGRVLNLASRLMDLARPSGIVFDDSFQIDLLEKETKELFSKETVYVRGVAEETPIKIHYTEKYTLIPDSYHYPLKGPKWKTETYEYKLKELKKLDAPLRPSLEKKPFDEKRIRVDFEHEVPELERMTKLHEYSVSSDEVTYRDRGDIQEVEIDIEAITKTLEEHGAKDDMTIEIRVIYAIE